MQKAYTSSPEWKKKLKYSLSTVQDIKQNLFQAQLYFWSFEVFNSLPRVDTFRMLLDLVYLAFERG